MYRPKSKEKMPFDYEASAKNYRLPLLPHSPDYLMIFKFFYLTMPNARKSKLRGQVLKATNEIKTISRIIIPNLRQQWEKKLDGSRVQYFFYWIINLQDIIKDFFNGKWHSNSPTKNAIVLSPSASYFFNTDNRHHLFSCKYILLVEAKIKDELYISQPLTPTDPFPNPSGFVVSYDKQKKAFTWTTDNPDLLYPSYLIQFEK